jgi:hypothetical protein
MATELGWGDIAQRMEQRTYAGPMALPTATNSNFSYVFSDFVPPDRYWLLYKASVVQDTVSSVAIGTLASSLHLLNESARPFGADPSTNLAPYIQQRLLMSRLSGVPRTDLALNAGEVLPPTCVRIDEGILKDGRQASSASGWTTPFETLLFGRSSRPLVVHEGYSLLGSNWFNPKMNMPSNPRIFLTLKILIVECRIGEDVNL